MTQDPPAAAVDLDSIRQGSSVAGFTAEAVYVDGRNKRVGGRFRHAATGFVLDLVSIESAPQAFIWINTFPTSDQGEPHTQEHLLLGKGNKGRSVASLEAMQLADSSAFTMQWRTCYHFHTIAGAEAFWTVFDAKMSGLLEPDYTDEEIRREVRNFGVATDPATGALQLEEKGTVYNEMVRTYEQPNSLMWRQLDHMLFGPKHPLARSSGGWPADIRTMTAEDIRRFHHQSHHLANMGMVAAFPRSIELGDALRRTDAILDRIAGRLGKAGRVTMTERDLPPPASAPAGEIRIVSYPHTGAQRPGTVALAWPPGLDAPLAEQNLLELFLGNVAGDETTNLYKKLIDSTTRQVDFGASGVWSYLSPEPGRPIYIGVTDVASTNLDEAGVRRVRDAVTAELARIAAWDDGDPELVAFNQRLAGRITELRRGLDKFMSSPPGFGFRGTGSGWMEHLRALESSPGFERSLVLRSELAWIERELGDGKTNLWKRYLPRWKLLAEPYGAATRSDPSMIETERKARDARITAELGRAGKDWRLTDPAAVVARYKEQYDENTAELEAADRGQPMPAFIDRPPMTTDDDLVWARRELPGGVAMIASTFDSMTGGTAGIAFDLRGIEERDARHLAALAMLLTEVGVIENGVPVSYEQMRERQRKEILSLSVSVSTNPRTGRVELVARGAGNNPDETERAIGWIELVLHHPDWRADNLPRIRDLVDQSAQSIRNQMLGAEESWVDDPPEIWRHQTSRLLAHTRSFLTRAHDLHRLRWLLRDPPDAAAGRALAGLLGKLPAAARLGRPALDELTRSPDKPRKGDEHAAKLARTRAAFKALPPTARPLANDAMRDLGQLLADIPDSSLVADWTYLCGQIAADLARPAPEVLADIDRVRRQVLRAAGARAFAIGAGPTLGRIERRLGKLVGTLSPDPVTPHQHTGERFIAERLRAREPSARAPLFVGLVNPNTSGGVHLHSAPSPTYADVDDEAVLRYLAGNLYTGHGAHSMFMKTWAAGLAYSNGLRPSIRDGRMRYYAERCPQLAQTLKFVITELERAVKTETSPSLADYAIAQAFDSRVAASFEHRGEAIAADLADGDTPDVIRRFRERLLEIRRARGKGLATELFSRMPEVYARVLPGWKTDPRTVTDAVYFVIGPAAQLDQWQAYLATAVGKDATLYRLYPRDFWLTESR